MEMKQNATYTIRIMAENRLLTYTGKILSEDTLFVTFLDRYNKTISVNKNNIVSFEEVEE